MELPCKIATTWRLEVLLFYFLPSKIVENLAQERHFLYLSARIPTSIKDRLESEAKKRNTNVNSLVNQILLKHQTYDLISEHANGIMLGRTLFTRILEKVLAEDMALIGKEINPDSVKRMFIFNNIARNIDNLVTYYFEPMGLFGGRYNFNQVKSELHRELIFEHRHGPKWSAFLKEYTANTIESITGVRPEMIVESGVVRAYLTAR